MTAPSATKHDQHKLRMDLIEPVWLEGVASVMTFGAAKYAPNNWRAGYAYTRLIGAMMRHTAAIARGEDYDPETGKLHAYHVSCCAMFLSWFQENGRTDLDDRIKLKPIGVRAKRSRNKATTNETGKGPAPVDNETNGTENGTENGTASGTASSTASTTHPRDEPRLGKSPFA